MLERFYAGKEFPVENTPELEVVRRFGGVRVAACDPLLELFDEPLPIANVFQI